MNSSQFLEENVYMFTLKFLIIEGQVELNEKLENLPLSKLMPMQLNNNTNHNNHNNNMNIYVALVQYLLQALNKGANIRYTQAREYISKKCIVDDNVIKDLAG